MTLTSEMLYPEYAVVQLTQRVGARWSELVDWIRTLPRTDPYAIAFTLTMRRLGRSLGRPQYHAMCAVCATELVQRFDGDEQELLTYYYHTLHDVVHTLEQMQTRKQVQHAA